MEGERAFADIMELIITLNQMLQGYNNTPRHYGTEDLLYQSEAHIIKHIGEVPGLSLNQLAERLYRTKSATSMMISKLSRKKLVTRKRDIEDNRRYILTLTSKGEKIFEFHQALDQKNYLRILQAMNRQNKLTPEELQTACRVLQQLTDAFNSPSIRQLREQET